MFSKMIYTYVEEIFDLFNLNLFQKELQKLRSLPLKGPTPIWLLNQKFLAPLFLSYDEKLRQNKEFIEKLQVG